MKKNSTKRVKSELENETLKLIEQFSSLRINTLLYMKSYLESLLSQIERIISERREKPEVESDEK